MAVWASPPPGLTVWNGFDYESTEVIAKLIETTNLTKVGWFCP
jgi:hypothetical protein